MQQVNNEVYEELEILIDDVYEFTRNFRSYDPKTDVPQDLADYAREELEQRMCGEFCDEDGNSDLSEDDWNEALKRIEEMVINYVESGEIWEHRDDPEDDDEDEAA